MTVSLALLKGMLGVFCAFLSHDAWAAKDAKELGKTLFLQGNQQGAIACMSCHGQKAEGLAAAAYPQLAGMDATYLMKQLADYKAGTRINPVMQPIAQALSGPDAMAVTQYVASLPPVPQPGEKPDAMLLKRGETIAQIGLWDRTIPACFACHGPDGRGVGSAFPRITQQNKAYLVQQLQAWKSGTRKNDPQSLMSTVARKLSAEEIEAVATYLSMQQGGDRS
jgi:cytochrome c553